jgi:hypothetical protein
MPLKQVKSRIKFMLYLGVHPFKRALKNLFLKRNVATILQKRTRNIQQKDI